MRSHLAVVLPRYVESILAGRKVVEVRLSVNRCAPHGRVAPGDVVYFKEKGGGVRARAEVARVDEFEGLTPRRVRGLARRYARAADARGAAYWRVKERARFGTMIWIRGVVELEGVASVRLYGAAWVVLEQAVGAMGLPGVNRGRGSRRGSARAIRRCSAR